MRRFTRLTPCLLVALTVSACANPAAPTSVPLANPEAAADRQEASIPNANATIGPDGETATATTMATKVPARYFAVAASAGFNRNNGWGYSYGSNYQGVLNTALSNCQRYSGTSCEHVAICGPSNGLSVSRPYVAVFRSSVYERSFPARGATGVSCGQASVAAAIEYARASCGLRECQPLVSGRIP